MALINVQYDPDEVEFRIRSVQAGDADEMVSRLTALLAAEEEPIVDLQLAGAGAGPLWEAWVVVGDANAGITLSPSTAAVVAAVAGNPTEARLRLSQKLAAFNAVTPISAVYKVVVAGGGVGPTYMAVALASTAPVL
jgi:hypothetical protein